MKPESLVIVNQYVTVNMFLGLVLTARHVMEAWEHPKSSVLRPKVESVTGTKS